MYIKNGCFRKFKYIISYVQPKIYQQPINGYVEVGDSFKFSLKARGTMPVTYQWYKNDFPLFGQNTNELLLTNIQDTDNATYYCEVKNYKNTIESKSVTLSVIKSPYIVTQPSSINTTLGSSITFHVSAIGSDPISYQWYKNNEVYIGATNKDFFINSVKTTDTGDYWAKITNQFGSVSSLTATLTIS